MGFWHQGAATASSPPLNQTPLYFIIIENENESDVQVKTETC